MCVFVFRYGLFAVLEIIYLIKNYYDVVFLSKFSLNKKCCKPNPFDSVIQAVTHNIKLLCYVYITFEKEFVKFCYVFR